MDLNSGYPYWVVKNGLLSNFPVLQQDVRCGALVVGAVLLFGSYLVDWWLARRRNRKAK